LAKGGKQGDKKRKVFDLISPQGEKDEEVFQRAWDPG